MLLNRKIQSVVYAMITVTLSACAVMPKDLDNYGNDPKVGFTGRVVFSNDRPLKTERNTRSLSNKVLLNQPLFSYGDWLRLTIMGMPEYSGLYQINERGELELPFGASIKASHSQRNDVIQRTQSALHELGWFKSKNAPVNISMVKAASADITVFGAVFNPGRVNINGQPATKPQDAVQQHAGNYTVNRTLTAAIMAAGGVRPDANLTMVTVERNGQTYTLDLSGLVSNQGAVQIPSLVHGDKVYIHSLGIENHTLIRPTQITPPGMRVLMSNLTAPALSNSMAAVGTDSTRLPYGSSLLSAAVSANCVGGTHQANASRSLVLITRHYGSNQQFVIRRSINQLLANSSDAVINPFVMPNDGIACYDSKFTNLRDVARGIGEVFGPILLGGLL